MDQRPVAVYQALLSDIAPYIGNPPVEGSDNGPPSYVKAFAAEALRDNFLRKWEDRSEKADATALNTFLTSNKKCEGWVSPLKNPTLNEADALLYGQFLRIVDDFFNIDYGPDVELNWANICEGARSGPGASIGARGFSFYAKHFSSELTATSQSLIDVYKAHIGLYPEFANAEIIRQEEFGVPRLVAGSRSSFVPKNLDTSRMIAVEPTVNMYLQLGLAEIISKRLHRHFGLTLETQPSVNRWLARRGSVARPGGDDAYSTIDLKSASDTLSLGLLGEAVPLEWQSAILELRCRQTNVAGLDVTQNMVSTMGNGFTFPFQTAIFCCVVSACLSLDDSTVMGRRPPHVASHHNPNGLFSVFGDDIIVLDRWYDRVVHLLQLIGCEVNSAKSFRTGGFRESCGHDYYHGYNVRPVYLRKLKTDQDISVVINLLNEWSSRTGIYVHNTIRYLWSLFNELPPVVPYSENMDAGVKVPFALIPTFNRSRLGVSSVNFGSITYRRYVSRSPRLRIGDGIIKVPGGHKRLIFNPSGLLMAFLRGEIRGGQITVRHNSSLPYDTKRAITPWWDYVLPNVEDQVFGLGVDKARWNTVATSHLEVLLGAYRLRFLKRKRS